MRDPRVNCLRVISFPDGEDYSTVTHEELEADIQNNNRGQYISKLRSLNSSWPEGAVNMASPHPVLVTKQHQEQVEQLHRALVLAIEDIIGRWWSDKHARFPERMPLEREEEELLQWIDNNQDLYRPWCERKGSWRPDILVENDETGAEHFRICEINARFCWNGYMLLGCGQEGLDTFGLESRGLAHATDANAIFGGLLGLFNHALPLYLVKGQEYGVDIWMFMEFAQKQHGLKMKLITPGSLRLIPDSAGVNGYKLCCLAQAGEADTFLSDSGELLEDIHQLCLELHQKEFRALTPEMQRQVSLRSFNDMRTILLAHDKRLLGIILEEMDSLTSRKILTSEQARRLNQGIAPTILPGSTALAELIANCKLAESWKDNYILKPIRGGKGAGILFGDELKNDDWLALLETMRSAKLVPGNTSYVIQRKIRQNHYDVILGSKAQSERCHMVGTYHSVNGIFLGLGVWRSGPGRLCAISHGASWGCSVVARS